MTESALEGQREALWVGMSNGEAAMQTLWRLLKKLETEFPCDPATPSWVYIQQN